MILCVSRTEHFLQLDVFVSLTGTVAKEYLEMKAKAHAAEEVEMDGLATLHTFIILIWLHNHFITHVRG